jgi:hypothetical protein
MRKENIVIPRRSTSRGTARLLLAALLALAPIVAGCNALDWANLNVNVVIPLGLGGDTGLFNPPDNASTLWPWAIFNNNTSGGGTGNSATESSQ